MADPSPNPSARLARAARAGCRRSFEELVRRHHGCLYRFLLWRTGSVEDAEDLTQETFLLAWRKLHHYRDRWRFRTWLYTLGWRLAVSRWRRRRVETGALAREPHGTAEEPHEILARSETSAALWSLAARVLSRDALVALWLHYGEDLAMDEVARVLGRRRGTVRVLLHRARRKLAQHQEGLREERPSEREQATPAPALARGTT